ncbi:MAG: DUF4292 domain-containing protein [Bacteroidota bacterium]
MTRPLVARTLPWGLAFLLAACASAPPAVVLDTRATSAPLLLDMVRRETARLVSLSGTGSVSFDSPELSGGAAFRSSLRRPDSLLVRLEGPFGLDVGTLFLSSGRYLVYSSLENKVITGTPRTAEDLPLPFRLTYEEIVGVFAGLLPAPPTEADLSLYEVEEGMFRLATACGGGTCEYWVDPAAMLVARMVRKDAAGVPLMEAECGAFLRENGATAPRRIAVRFPGQGRSLTVRYSALALNTPDVSFSFSIPETAEIIRR